jgi:N-acyl-L-homoserine lactone synthetase
MYLLAICVICLSILGIKTSTHWQSLAQAKFAVNKIDHAFNMRGMVKVAEYRLASETWEMDELLRLRYQVYCKEKQWLKADDYPDGRETDQFDAHSVHFLALKNNEVAGTVRAIFPSESGLPITNLFRITVPESVIHYVEISRLAVDKDARGLEFTIGLLHALFSWCVERGVTHGYAVLENNLLEFLMRIGYPFKKVGDQKFLYGGYNLPVCMELSAIASLYFQISLLEKVLFLL